MSLYWTIALVGVAVSVLVVIAIVILQSRDRQEPQLESDMTDVSSSVIPQPDPQYPHLPGAVSRPPEWMLNETDQPFDLRAFYSTISPDQNAAPLYLDALAEFDSLLSVCFPNDDAAARKVHADTRSQEFGRVFDGTTRRIVFGVPAADVERLLASYELGFEKIARAQQRPRCAFETELSIFANLPHLVAARHCAGVASLRVTHDLQRGEFNSSLQTLDMVLRMARDLRFRASFISQIVAVAIDSLAGRFALDILSAQELTWEITDQLVAVLAEQERLALPNPLAEAWRAEYVLYRNYLNDLECRTGIFSPEGLAELGRIYGERIGTPGEAIAAGNRASEMQFKTHPARYLIAADIDATLDRLRVADWKQEIRATSSYYRELIGAATLPYLQQREALSRIAADGEKCLVLSMSCPMSPLVPIAVVQAVATRRGFLCLAVIRRWELMHGTPAPSLKAACKAAGLASIPIDPFSDKPMQMTMLDSKPVVYSVGPDGRDDGGRLEWTDSDQPGDILFRLPIRK
jgi:hypothetical protein